ncbi:MAG TPA: DUF3459 domain-containing protein, partial [Dehalococcoidia bacterium]|nr:DUF3459 domain-containing protein [Dehalococcoidia bacterium]
GDVPDPQAEETFRRSKLNRALQTEPRHAALLALHRELLRLRRDLSVLRELERSRTHVAHDDSGTLVVRRWSEEGEFVAAFRLRAEPGNVALPLAGGPWRKLLDSEEERWQGAGSAVPPTIDSAGSVVVSLAGWSFVMLYRER